MTVAVATCGRPARLARCIAALAIGSSRPGEVIVVDQAPTPEAREVVESCGIARARYLEQRRLGLSASRNAALAAASGAVLAVTDDDCVPDRDWVRALAAAFEREPRPVAVTGAILEPSGPRPADAYAISLHVGTTPIDHTGHALPWMCGSGGNFAAWRESLVDRHGWDERLGAGSPGRAAEDAELLYRILCGGGIVRYEPAAVVRHDWQSWERRLRTRWSYGYGLGALGGIMLRRGDRFALHMLGVYARDHLRQLAGAARRLDNGRINEHARALASLLPGLVYGLRV